MSVSNVILTPSKSQYVLKAKYRNSLKRAFAADASGERDDAARLLTEARRLDEHSGTNLDAAIEAAFARLNLVAGTA